MKKALIIYAAVFLLTLIIPAIICFSGTKTNTGSSDELVNIFRQCITPLVYYR